MGGDEPRRDFLLEHGELARIKDWTDSPREAFESDLVDRKLASYRGTWVAYQKSVLAGQGEDGSELYNKASAYFGQSSLAVFRVPAKGESLEKALQQSLGHINS